MNRGIFAQPKRAIFQGDDADIGDLFTDFAPVAHLTNPGPSTFINVSAGWEEFLVVAMGAGGGAAGGKNNSGHAVAANGGAGGALAIVIVRLPPFASVSCTVGQGGIGTDNLTNGSNGGSTSFGSFVTCGGGEGGKVAYSSVEVTVASSSGGSVSIGGGRLIVSSAGISAPSFTTNSGAKYAYGGAPPGGVLGAAAISLPGGTFPSSNSANGFSFGHGIAVIPNGDMIDTTSLSNNMLLATLFSYASNINQIIGDNKTSMDKAGNSKGAIAGGSLIVANPSGSTTPAGAGNGGIGGGGGRVVLSGNSSWTGNTTVAAGGGGPFGGGGGAVSVVATYSTEIAIAGGAGGVGAGGGAAISSNNTQATTGGNGGPGMLFIAKRVQA